MTEKYGAITNLLKREPELSLKIFFQDMNYGIKNIRVVEIQEPNPNKGEIAGEGDQQYIQESRRAKRGFSFSTKYVNQGLELLEKACKGIKGLESTVSSHSIGNENPIHGKNKPQGGLDNWIFEDCLFKIQKQGDVLVPRISVYNFGMDCPLPISVREANSVYDSVELFENNPVDASIIRNIRQGSLIQYRTKRDNKWLPPRTLMAEYGTDVLNPRFLEEYQKAVKQLKPFDVPKEVKDALFVSMLLKKFYSNAD